MDDEIKLKVERLHTEAQERQKKQRFKQIILPIIVVGVLLVIVLAFAIVSALSDSSGIVGYKAGQITLIIVLFLALLVGFLLIYILFKTIDGLYKLNQTLPDYGKIALGGVIQAEEGVRTVADASVEPVMTVQEFGSKVKQVGESMKSHISPEGKQK